MTEVGQKKVWDNIAEEWFEFKTTPAFHTLQFLKNKKGKILDLGGGQEGISKSSKKEKCIWLISLKK
jgi:hypothetical protein